MAPLFGNHPGENSAVGVAVDDAEDQAVQFAGIERGAGRRR
ncbi:hypothetical protein [Streptomyces sp. CBMA152]|nr:hypothetical protein [Streptomyces sp. CBMA152]